MTPEQEAEVAAYREFLAQGEPADEMTDEQVLERIQFDRSKKWLEDFAEQVTLSYRELLEAAHNFISTGEYLIEDGRFEYARSLFYASREEFWDHFTRVTYRPAGEEDFDDSIHWEPRQGFFSCSC